MWAPTVSSDELYHHGILGMKHGKRNGPPYPLDRSDYSALEKKMARTDRKIERTKKRDSRLERKAAKYDEKAAKYHYKSEKSHAKYDLGKSKHTVRKAARLALKSAKIRNKSLKTASEERKLKLQNKADKIQYKADLYNMRADTLAKTAKYNQQALQLAQRSNYYKSKADKARMKMSADSRKQHQRQLEKEKLEKMKNDPHRSKEYIDYNTARNAYIQASKGTYGEHVEDAPKYKKQMDAAEKKYKEKYGTSPNPHKDSSDLAKHVGGGQAPVKKRKTAIGQYIENEKYLKAFANEMQDPKNSGRDFADVAKEFDEKYAKRTKKK